VLRLSSGSGVSVLNEFLKGSLDLGSCSCLIVLTKF
jgi:hypothetical protein